MERLHRTGTVRPAPLIPLALLFACTAPTVETVPSVNPQRPFLSTTSRTVPENVVELEVGAQVDPSDRVDTPTTLKYGLGPRTETFFTTSPYSMVDYNEQLPDGSGWGDTYIGFRHRLADRDVFSPAYGFDIQTKLPTARPKKGLGSGEMDWLASLNASQTYYGNEVTAYYQLGLLGEPVDDGVDVRHTGAVQVRAPYKNQFSGLGELAMVWEPELDREEATLLVGASYLADTWTMLDFGLRIGLTKDAPDVQVFFGLTRTLGSLVFPSSGIDD